MASPKETGEGVDFIRQEHVTSSTGIGCAIIASGIPVYFIFVTEYPLKKPAPIRRFLGHRMHFGKNHLFSPSQHNNRVAEAVWGGDAAEKFGLKFSKDCTTWSRCTRWQIIPSHFESSSHFQEFRFSGVERKSFQLSRLPSINLWMEPN